MDNVRLGIVGLGRLGKIHATNIAKYIPGATLAAACSIVGEELEFAQNELGVKEVYSAYEEMVASPNLDAVCIVSPSGFHTEQIRLAMDKGLHVFSEKPIGLDVEDIKESRQPDVTAFDGLQGTKVAIALQQSVEKNQIVELEN